jgi:hypothetical protein
MACDIANRRGAWASTPAGRASPDLRSAEIARRRTGAGRVRGHLMRVSEGLLAVTELELIEQAKREITEKRRRITGL